MKSKELWSQRSPSLLQTPKQLPPSGPAIGFIKLFAETFKLMGRYGQTLESARSNDENELRCMTITPVEIFNQRWMPQQLMRAPSKCALGEGRMFS
jgi:hypothetical protein